MQKYPEVRVEIDATSRRVDVVREGFDVALRVRYPPLEVSGLTMLRMMYLLSVRQQLSAAWVLLKCR